MTRLRKIMLEERKGRKSLRWRLARLGIRRFDPISELSKLGHRDLLVTHKISPTEPDGHSLY